MLVAVDEAHCVEDWSGYVHVITRHNNCSVYL